MQNDPTHLVYNFELECPELLTHIRDNKCVDFLVASAPHNDILERDVIVFSKNVALVVGVYKGSIPVGKLSSKNLATMEDPKFKQLLPFTDRLSAISQHITLENGEAIDDDMDKETIEVFQTNLTVYKHALGLDQSMIDFFEDHETLLNLVARILSRTHLTLDQLIKKRKEVFAKACLMKLVQLEECFVPIMPSNPKKGGQIMHNISDDKIIDGSKFEVMNLNEVDLSQSYTTNSPHTAPREPRPSRRSDSGVTKVRSLGFGGDHLPSAVKPADIEDEEEEDETEI